MSNDRCRRFSFLILTKTAILNAVVIFISKVTKHDQSTLKYSNGDVNSQLKQFCLNIIMYSCYLNFGSLETSSVSICNRVIP